MNIFRKLGTFTNKFVLSLRANADWIAKLTAAFVAIAVAVIANNYESKMTAVSMFNQREQAESELRANMFSNLINPISGQQQNGDIDVERLLLLTELLTLNFHEHFEFKPLLEYVDDRLRDFDNNETSKQARSSLTSIARRIVDRQIASIIQEGSEEDRTKIDELVFIQKPKEKTNRKGVLQRFTMGSYALIQKQNGEWELKTTGEETGKTDGFGDWLTGEEAPLIKEALFESSCLSRSRDGKWDLHIIVNDFNRGKKEYLDIYTGIVDNEKQESLDKQFTLSSFDFPLTDNTLLSDGNRYAIVLHDMVDINFTTADQSGVIKTKIVYLKVIWFPKNYFTPRERPIDYDKFLDKTGLKRE